MMEKDAEFCPAAVAALTVASKRERRVYRANIGNSS
jgi:hypothetical protein